MAQGATKLKVEGPKTIAAIFEGYLVKKKTVISNFVEDINACTTTQNL